MGRRERSRERRENGGGGMDRGCSRAGAYREKRDLLKVLTAPPTLLNRSNKFTTHGLSCCGFPPERGREQPGFPRHASLWAHAHV